MSPEQALGERVDHRTDIFSLGIVLYEMLTGKLPFAGKTAAALALQIVQSSPVPASTINRAVPQELDAVLAKALAKSIDQRYESAATMTAELFSVAAILDTRTEISESSNAPSVGATQPRRRRPYFKWLVFGVLLLSATRRRQVDVARFSGSGAGRLVRPRARDRRDTTGAQV